MKMDALDTTSLKKKMNKEDVVGKLKYSVFMKSITLEEQNIQLHRKQEIYVVQL